MTDLSSSNHHGLTKSHHRDHTISAEALSDKLEKLREELEVQHHHHRGHSHHGQIHIDKELSKRANETINDILERLEKQKNDIFEINHSMPGIEDNGHGRVRHTDGLNPSLLEANGSLKQSHGNANLRHSRYDSG